MPIETIFAHVSCSNLEESEKWYAKVFGREADRHPMDHLAEWHFTDSAEVQLFEDAEKAGSSTLTLGVLPMDPEVERMRNSGLKVGEVGQADDYYILRMRDPDGNLVVLASARRS
jgi:catechol 2,3-dioxygenase-like lactoylglutathione lyase family enzyme